MSDSPEHSRHSSALPQQLLTAWPAGQWRSVNVVVAVSAGPDSMALLRALLDAAKDFPAQGTIIVGHVNHGLRGVDSDADETWLREQCDSLDVPLQVERARPFNQGSSTPHGGEEAARHLRYRLLREIAEREGARYVATGHTRDDHVETILFRLLRGTGLRGMAGIRRARSLSPAVTVVRPLLECRREDVLQYLEQIGQTFHNDATNRSPRFARNRIRNEVLPFIRDRFGAHIDDSLARVGATAYEAQELIESLANTLIMQCAIQQAGPPCGLATIVLKVAPLAMQPELLTCEVFRQAWRQAAFPEQKMTRTWWQKLAQFAAAGDEHDALNLPGNIRASWQSPGVLALSGGLSY